MQKSRIIEIHNRLLAKEINPSQIIAKSKEIINNNSNLNSLITENIDSINAADLEKKLKDNENNLLYCIPYSLKDNICTKDIRTTGASLFLENYVPKYDSYVYSLIKEKNAILIGKENLDEFGFGGTGLNSFIGHAKNLYDPYRICGGSSSGVAINVASGSSIFSIWAETGDSIRKPASYLGIVGFKPTYGLISRQGVLPFAPSLDTVGILTQYVSDVAIVADTIIKFDKSDYSSQISKEKNYFNNLHTLNSMTINVINGLEEFMSTQIRSAYLDSLNLIKENGHKIVKINVDMDMLRMLGTIYKIISYSEGTSCYFSYSGIPFGRCNKSMSGYKNILFENRSNFFGDEIKRRFIIGSYILNGENYEKIFIKSNKYRTLIKNITKELFENCDAFLIPGSSSIAPLINDVIENKMQKSIIDDLLLIANFTSCPSITIPFTKINNLPFGINLNCKKFNEQQLLNVALTIENIFKFERSKND